MGTNSQSISMTDVLYGASNGMGGAGGGMAGGNPQAGSPPAEKKASES